MTGVGLALKTPSGAFILSSAAASQRWVSWTYTSR